MRSILLFIIFCICEFNQISSEETLNVTTPSTVTNSDLSTEIMQTEPNFCNTWNLNNTTQIGCIFDNHTIKCHNGIDDLFEFKSHQMRRTHQMILCGLKNVTFKPNIFTKFPKLKSLHIEYGLLANISADFPKLNHLQNISITYTQLTHVQNTLFNNLPMLMNLDLRRNQLKSFDGPLLLQPKFQKMLLNGNPWNCSKNMKWTMQHSKNQRIGDYEYLQCADTSFKNQSISYVMRIKKSLRKMCHTNPELANCTCSLSYITLHLNGVWRPMYSINCSHLNLYQLPSTVPENTTTFYATHNKIRSTEPLLNAYRSVRDIYLDYNEIESIEALESDNWLERFSVLSLKGNRLQKVTAYLLENALERNHHAHALYLSENPWHCECIFTLRFQELLQAHRSIIKDFSDIRCEFINADGEIATDLVLALNRGDVCILPTEDSIQPIDLLNAIMAALILFIIFKLIYDYYHYRKSGRLPWLVTKMP